MKCHITGAIQTNKKFIPNEIKKSKICEKCNRCLQTQGHIITGTERQTNRDDAQHLCYFNYEKHH